VNDFICAARSICWKLARAVRPERFGGGWIASTSFSYDARDDLAATARGEGATSVTGDPETPAMSDLRGIGGRIWERPLAIARWTGRAVESTGVDSVTIEPFTLPHAWAPRAIEASCVPPRRIPAACGRAGRRRRREAYRRATADAGDGSGSAFAKLGRSKAHAVVRTR
jgi:hypothetical protein